MRYYLYISDAKIEMLFPQVPGATQHKVAAKVGFDLKLFSGSMETQRDTFNSRIARLHAVEEHLRSLDGVGTPTDKTSWLVGTLDAKFVDIGDGAILFVSQLDGMLIALGGSSRHLLGSAAPQEVGIPASHLPQLTSQLTRLVERDPAKLLKLPESFLQHYIAAGVDEEFDAWINVIRSAWDKSTNPPQRIDFMAKRLVTKRTGIANEECTLATPLYVSPFHRACPHA